MKTDWIELGLAQGRLREAIDPKIGLSPYGLTAEQLDVLTGDADLRRRSTRFHLGETQTAPPPLPIEKKFESAMALHIAP